MGRQAAGVTGISLREGDRVASMDIVEEGGGLLLITSRGWGKRVRLDEFMLKGRAIGGVMTLDHKSLHKTGKLAVARVVQENDEVALFSASGVALRVKVSSIPFKGRTAQGVSVMHLDEGDSVASLARLPREEA
jgi:DNA gyrase subunit A